MSKSTRSSVKKALLATVLGAAAVGAFVTPAHAGGDNIHYIFGSSVSACTKNLNKAVKLYRINDYEVTGVHGCRLAGDRHRYFGDFVANPR